MSERLNGADRVELSIVGQGRARRLRAEAAQAAALGGLQGTSSAGGLGVVLDGPLSAANAAEVRRIAGLAPAPLGIATSAGVGDRIGRATPGHAMAFRAHGQGVVPVFAQQSAREMDRLSRSPQEVLDDATFGALQAGWRGPVGADADHLKSIDDIDRCLAAGFTTFTLDTGDFVRSAADRREIPWAGLEDDESAMAARYESLVVEAGDQVITMTPGQTAAAAVKYGAAVARTVELYRHLLSAARHPVEVEICVDETAEETTPQEHVYLATELSRLGVRWIGFAPRFPGDFEKGVEYRGDRDALRRSLVIHSALARHFGPYKVSVHSGSDKFGIYPMIARETDGLVHLKTSGTSYLVAVGVAARFDPALFRSIYTVSREAYREARTSYHVTAEGTTPDAALLADDELPGLVESAQSRQQLHVGYGEVLREPDGLESELARGLLDLLDHRHVEYAQALADHLGRHLAPFARNG